MGLEHPRTRFGLTASYRAGMEDIAGGDGSDIPQVPEILTLDAALEGQATPHLAIYGTATNLTGSQAVVSWRPFGARPTSPFQVMVGIKLTPRE